MKCPVCRNEARNQGTRDRGEVLQVNCPRCGKFEITRTAVSMLHSKTRSDRTSIARLSHALRTTDAMGKEQPTVSSSNLDEMLSKQLPDLHWQTIFFLAWFSDTLQDDLMKSISLPPLDYLAGIVGAVNADRVKKLVEHSVENNYIQKDKNKFHMTDKGWNVISQVRKERDALKKRKEMPEEKDDLNIKSLCSRCEIETNSIIKGKFVTSGNDKYVSWRDSYYIVQCLGCDTITFRYESWFSEFDEYAYNPITGEEILIPGITTETWPTPRSRVMQPWVHTLQDDVLQNLFKEIYSSLDNNNLTLSMIGARTLLDRSMYLAIGDPQGGFIGKIEEMINKGKIGFEEKDIMITLTDIGSASAHRGYNPNLETVNNVLTAVESVIYRNFVLPICTEIVFT